MNEQQAFLLFRSLPVCRTLNPLLGNDHSQIRQALEALQQEQHLLEELLEIFLEEAPHRLEQIRQALQGQDAATLRLAAHTLKGTVRYFGARRASQLARRLELLGREGPLEDGGPLLADLQQEIEKLIAILLEYKPGQQNTD